VKRLASCVHGKDNNLNLLRLVASWAVLLSHAWPIARGAGTPQPLEEATGWTLGEVAVWMFFLVSGLLIAASWERRPQVGSFLRARAFRLFPALLASIALVALVMGPLVSALPLGEYLGHRGTWSFLARNWTLVQPQYTLPGVFEQNPYPTVEGSIWTLWHEVVCYLGILGAGLAGLLQRRRTTLLLILAYALGLSWIGRTPDVLLHPRLDQSLRLAVPFALGTAAWLSRERVPISAWVSVLLSGVAWAAHETWAGTLLFQIALLSWTLWLAYGIEGRIRAFNRVGDYSYGIYIYAFPLQGLVQWLDPDLGPLGNAAWATLLTLALAIPSWHWIERPALARKRPAATPTSG
jgi:peptidoglycan/LPS O-acetylase OafA/YrhL